MGADKLLLPFGAGTVAGSLVAALRGGGIAEVVLVVSARRAADGGPLLEWAQREGVVLAVNPDPGRGMLSSVREGIAAAGGGEALAAAGRTLAVTPADLPALAAATVAELLRRFAASRLPLAVPVHRGRRGHPLLVAARLIPEIATLDETEGLRQLLDRHPGEVLAVPVDDPGVVQDVDTPGAYRELLGE